jgi:hypothetical protein
MAEIKVGEIPIPLINYVNLIKRHIPPYCDIVEFILKDMEFRYYNAQKEGQSEIVYTINPRTLQKEIEKKIKSEKLTTTNICRTILALFICAGLKEDENFYVTITTNGRRNYHVRVNTETINLLWKPLLV